MEYQQIGKDFANALEALRNAYPESVGVDVWVNLNSQGVEYTVCVRPLGAFESVSDSDPSMAVKRLIEKYPPKSDAEIKAERIAKLTEEIEELKESCTGIQYRYANNNTMSS